jgi:hypothetical protein
LKISQSILDKVYPKEFNHASSESTMNESEKKDVVDKPEENIFEL